MEIFWERPGQGGQSEPIARFLEEQGLRPDHGVQATVSLREDGRILACGGLEGNVIKTVAVDPSCQGQGLAEVLMTELRREAFARGHRQLFVFTKPEQRGSVSEPEPFSGGLQRGGHAAGKHPGRATPAILDSLPMSGGVHGGGGGCTALRGYPGAPMPGGSERGGLGRAGRMYLSCRRTRGCSRRRTGWRWYGRAAGSFPTCRLHPTMGYLISNATFPTYFLKDRSRGQEISCQLDLEIFAGSFAPALGLQKRFVGTEPLDPVTRQYNEALQASLPGRGIAVVELPRLEVGGQPVSASRVRACLAAGDLASVRQLVPDTTYAYCASKLGG